MPKRRRKAIFGQARRIFHALARQKECQIIEGHLMPDYVHMCFAIPPKHPVASVIGFLKGRLCSARWRGPFCVHMRVQSLDELKARILKGIEEINAAPVRPSLEEVRRARTRFIGIRFSETLY